MKNKWIPIISGLMVVSVMMAMFSGCTEKRSEEITYTPQDGQRYENCIEIDGQWGASLATGPDGQYGIGDPFVMRFNGKYYLYPSTSDPCDGIKVFQSEDLINWTDMGYAVAPSENTVHGAYAPEVIYYNGWFYLCQSRAGQGHYIYRSESPTEGFTLVSTSPGDPDHINYGNLGMGIDGSFYVADDGKLYLLHTSTPSGLKYNLISDLDNICYDTLGAPKTLGDANLRGWIEGPGIIRRGEYSYLTYTGNHVISKGYRIAYSYAKNLENLSNFVQPRDNVTIIDTDPDHYGLGHSSNFVGPDLDSIYTAYHNLVGSGPARRYNLDRYLTNGGVMTANGVTHWAVLAPVRPDAEAENGKALTYQDGKYILGTTDDYFTAEFNFYPQVGQKLYFGGYSLCVENGMVSLYRGDVLLGQAALSLREGAMAVVRIENGDGVGYVYVNGMRLLTYEAQPNSGLLGYAISEGVEYTAFTNDVFGTSDFEALKNFPTAFPATSYLKGENRGFSIADAQVVSGGLRVGEKQSLVYVSEDDCWAVKLCKNDWVKYGIDVPESGGYAIAARVTAASAGAKLRITIGESSFTCTIPEKLNCQGETVKISMGKLELQAGMSTMKVEVLSGTAECITFESFQNASAQNEVRLSDFEAVRGDVVIGDDAIIVTGQDAHSTALWKNVDVCNFRATFTFTCQLDNSSNLGLMIRAADYSYFSAQPTQSWRGYYLQIGQHLLTLSRYDYGEETLGAVRVDDAFADSSEHSLTITAESNKITVVLDGTYTMAAFDDCAFLSGQLGIFATGGQITITDFSYTEL